MYKQLVKILREYWQIELLENIFGEEAIAELQFEESGKNNPIELVLRHNYQIATPISIDAEWKIIPHFLLSGEIHHYEIISNTENVAMNMSKADAKLIAQSPIRADTILITL